MKSKESFRGTTFIVSYMLEKAVCSSYLLQYSPILKDKKEEEEEEFFLKFCLCLARALLSAFCNLWSE